MDAFNERYTADLPSAQSAIDIFKGQWISSFPAGRVEASSGGEVPLFEDGRISWFLQKLGSAAPSMRILELGPFEGGHSFMLHEAGVPEIVAVEGNSLNYLKTLLVKDLFALDRLELRHGEIEAWLSATDERFDAILASGVLYHFVDPLLALRRMTCVADQLFIWTHFVHSPLMPPEDPRWGPFTGEVGRREVDGFECVYYTRSYLGAQSNATFCGGARDTSVWMEHDAIVYALNHWGFCVEEIMLDPAHQSGPCSCFYAWR